MKNLLLGLLILAGVGAKADPASTHGMLIFGREQVYVSHLPMFHKPHDYQVILKVDLGKQQTALLDDMKANPNESVYTIEPEEFVLPDMVKGLKAFKATVYRGHFERGGKPLFEATVQPKAVVVFKKLNPNEAKPKKLSILIFGTKTEGFIAHNITGRPNFDQIAKVDGIQEASETVIKKNGHQPAEILNLDDSTEAKKGSRLHANPIMLQLQKEIYTEFGDLK